MSYRRFRTTTLVMLAMVLAMGLFGRTARAYGPPIGGYSTPFWGPSAGARVCDATNVDGICISWHSVLKGINPARLANCTPWGCDLRAFGRPMLVAPWRDDSVAWQLSVVPHDIAPLMLDANAKPKKASPHQEHEIKVEGPAGTRDDHGPIVPQVIEVHTR